MHGRGGSVRIDDRLDLRRRKRGGRVGHASTLHGNEGSRVKGGCVAAPCNIGQIGVGYSGKTWCQRATISSQKIEGTAPASVEDSRLQDSHESCEAPPTPHGCSHWTGHAVFLWERRHGRATLHPGASGPQAARPASPDFRAAKRFPECVNRAGLSVEPCTGACQAALPGRGGFCDGCSRVPWRKKRRARGSTIR